MKSAAILDLILESGADPAVAGAGRSMLPLIRTGDTVRFDPAAPYAPGDILLCRTPAGGAVVHRLLRLDGDHVILRGDANPLPDPPFPRELVAGKVTALVRRGRTLDLQSPALRAYGRAMIALTPAAPLIHGAVIGGGRAGTRLLAGPLAPFTRRLLPPVAAPRRMPASFLTDYIAHRSACLADPGALAAALADGSAVLVAASDSAGKLAAVGEARRVGAEAELRWLWVHPLRRRQGLGTAAVRELSAWAAASGASLRAGPELRGCRIPQFM